MIKIKAASAFTNVDREIETENKYIHLYIRKKSKLKTGLYSFGLYAFLKTDTYNYYPMIEFHKIQDINSHYHYRLHLPDRLKEIQKIFNEKLPELQRKMIKQIYEKKTI